MKGSGAVSRKRAIRDTLGRLGMQASNREVVAALAEVGIGVTEGLVRQVKVELLKGAARGDRQRAGLPRVSSAQLRRPPKIPPRRGRRS